MVNMMNCQIWQRNVFNRNVYLELIKRDSTCPSIRLLRNHSGTGGVNTANEIARAIIETFFDEFVALEKNMNQHRSEV
jgi:hypothetical protein